uniref:Uncharacterized protein n=1 Tax=Tanacetum cinerariifolium TaxID=118510 RepID=A0A6L2L221_TANCI|nr:hypothetical protein [Tanacetum cinerariifolium]
MVAVAAAVVVTFGVVAVHGGEWFGGSNRSGDEDRFWVRRKRSPKKFSDGSDGGGGGGRRVVAGGWLEWWWKKEIDDIKTPPHYEAPRDRSYEMDVVFDGVFEGVRDEEVFVGEGVVVISSSLDMLRNSCLGGIMVSLIFLEGLDEEALVEFMVEWCEGYEDEDRNEEDDLFNYRGKDQSGKA